MNANQPLAIVSEHPYSRLSGENAIRSLALAISQTSLPCSTVKQAWEAIEQIEQQWKAPLHYLPDNPDFAIRRLISIVRYLRQVDTVPATIAIDNSSQWDTSRDEINTDLVLSAADRHNIGIAFAEYRGDIQRVALRYYRRKGLTHARQHDAAQWAASEAYTYAIDQIGRGSLSPADLFEAKRWFGILRTICPRYFRSLEIVQGFDRDEPDTLESVVGRSLDSDFAEWSADELDYIVGLDDNTPDWVVDTVAALLALPDGTNDEQAALLGLRPATYRKRLQRTREYFSTRS